MFNNAKYIIIVESGVEVPIVFSDQLSHSDIAKNKTVVAAGFCHIGSYVNSGLAKTSVWAGGKSVTLKIESRVGDADIIKKEICREEI